MVCRGSESERRDFVNGLIAFSKNFLYKLLHNRVYLGEAVHKGTAYPGDHTAIIDRSLWDRIHGMLASTAPQVRANRARRQTPALLRGLVFGPSGCAMTPCHTRRRGKLYRYYRSMDTIRHGAGACPIGSVPAAEVETAVIDQVRALLRTPEVVLRTWRAAKQQGEAVPEREVLETLHALDPLWDELFPAEQARIIQLLVDRVDVGLDGISIRLRTDGLASLVGDLRSRQDERRAA